VNSYKVLIKNIGRDKFRDISDIIDEETIFGKPPLSISVYAKNAIYTNWIEILQYLHHSDLTITQLNKVFDMALKNIFDNTLYLSTQQLSLRLIKSLIEAVNSNRSIDAQQQIRRYPAQVGSSCTRCCTRSSSSSTRSSSSSARSPATCSKSTTRPSPRRRSARFSSTRCPR